MNRINAIISMGDTKSRIPASTKKKTTGRTAAKLKSSKWYQSAAGSIGITKKETSHSR